MKTFTVEKVCSPKILIFKKTVQVNNISMGEHSPNLVTLPLTKVKELGVQQ
jgi:hypothetical protein